MNPKERYIRTLTFQHPDKIPLMPGGPRESTTDRWAKEGLPEGIHGSSAVRYIIEEMLGLPSQKMGGEKTGWFSDFRMIPQFEETVLEHKDGHYTLQDWMGAIVQISDRYDATYLRTTKDFVTRRWLKFPVETKEDFEKLKWRYDPDDPARLPENLKEVGRLCRETDAYIQVNVNGPFWQMREWMGMENLCIAFIEEPEFVREMIAFWDDFVYRLLSKIVEYIPITNLRISEDMAYKGHPMIGADMTRDFILPTYKHWTSLVRSHGTPIVCMDSDGYIEDLIPVWIEGGVNVCEPMEVAAGNDIVRYREKFGHAMAYYGGIDKRALAAGGDIMRAEVIRIAPVVRDGGMIPSCDHGVPADISFDNFVEYTRLLAKLTGWDEEP